jgi:hypothetical protein
MSLPYMVSICDVVSANDASNVFATKVLIFRLPDSIFSIYKQRK